MGFNMPICGPPSSKPNQMYEDHPDLYRVDKTFYSNLEILRTSKFSVASPCTCHMVSLKSLSVKRSLAGRNDKSRSVLLPQLQHYFFCLRLSIVSSLTLFYGNIFWLLKLSETYLASFRIPRFIKSH